MSMENYIGTTKNLINHIMVVGDEISDCEKVLYILGGLDFQYSSLITNITQKKCKPSLDEVFNALCIHGKHLERMNGVTN